MRKLCMTVALALVATCATTAAATAASTSVSPGGAITATSIGRLTFSTAGLSIIECDLALQGSLATGPIEKVQGARLGAMTGVAITNCNLGVTAVALNLPWDIDYTSISGTLPNDVTGSRKTIIIGIQVSNFPFAGTCLYGGAMDIVIAAVRTGTPGTYTTGTVAIGSATVSRVSGGMLCPATASARGSFSLTPTQTLTRM